MENPAGEKVEDAPSSSETDNVITPFDEPVTTAAANAEENHTAATNGNGNSESNAGEIAPAAEVDEPHQAEDETAASSEDTMDVEGAAAPVDPKEDAPTQEEVINYEETRRSVQEELINTVKAPPGRKRKTLDELKALSVRNYLDETVVPQLLVAMSELARRRPERPLEWLSKYLEREQAKETGEVDHRGDSAESPHHLNHGGASKENSGGQDAVLAD